MNEKPNYYAIIPGEVRYDPELKDKAKLLYGEITALSNKEGYCYASNTYFAELYGVSVRTIKIMINNLVDKGYLGRTIIYKEGTKEVLQRRIYLVKKMSLPSEEIFTRGGEEIFTDNNTSINNTNNKKEIYKERFKKPTLEEVKAYCTQRNNKIDAQRFIDFYEANNWTDSKGNKVKSWKQKIITWESHQPKQNTKKDIVPEWFDKDLNTKQESEDEDLSEREQELIREILGNNKK